MTSSPCKMIIELAILLSLCYAGAFNVVGTRGPSRLTATSTSTSVSMVGNLLSGLTGIPPRCLLDKAWKDDLLSRTSLQDKQLECAYKGSRDGWSAIDFHEAVDERGSGLVVALSRSGTVFGGFNPVGWRSSDDYFSSTSAFLWFAKGGKVVKCPVFPGGNAAIFDYATGGPCFGASDLCFGSPKAAVLGGFAGPDMMDTRINAGNLREASCSMGGAYSFSNDWPARGRVQLAEVEVYCNSKIRKDSLTSGWPF